MRRFLMASAMFTAMSGGAAVASSISTVEQQIAQGFRDPASVQFRNIVTFEGRKVLIMVNGYYPPGPLQYETLKVICGEVNAKNGFGGYVGFQSFRAEYHPATGQLNPIGNSAFSMVPCYR